MKATYALLAATVLIAGCQRHDEAYKFMIKERDSEFDKKSYSQLKDPTALVTPTEHVILLGANAKFIMYCIAPDQCITGDGVKLPEVEGTIAQVFGLLAKAARDRQAAQQLPPVAPDGKPVGQVPAGNLGKK